MNSDIVSWLNAAPQSPGGWVLLFLFLVFGPPAILSKSAGEKLAGLGIPARRFQAWRVRRAAEKESAEEVAAFEKFRDMEREIEWLTKQVSRLDDLLGRVQELEDAQHGYIQYAQRRMASLELWASSEGIELPPPPFQNFEAWKQDRQG